MFLTPFLFINMFTDVLVDPKISFVGLFNGLVDPHYLSFVGLSDSLVDPHYSSFVGLFRWVGWTLQWFGGPKE